MKSTKKKTAKKNLMIAATAALAAVASIPNSANAEEQKPGVIEVSATGTATIAPDMAVLYLSVQREGTTAREALDANNAAMKDVLDAMKTAGIADRDLQTSNFNIQPRYFYPQPSKTGEQEPPRIIGYLVQNDLTVRVRKLSDLGAILDRSVTLGVNSGGNISFTSDNPDNAIEAARKDAVARAIAKARVLTEAAGVKLGRILEISEQNGMPPQPKMMARMAAAEAVSMDVPMASGENAYTITVSVRWELMQ